MTQVRSFVAENRSSLTRNISGLNKISKTLVKQRDALDKTLQYAPGALNNLYLAGNVKQGTLDTRDVAGELFNELQEDPAATLCTIIGQANPPGGVCSQIGNAMKSNARNRPGALSATSNEPPRVVEPIDPTMGGLLEPTR
jgi:ABC-type transporter Mla subunit MlaD